MYRGGPVAKKRRWSNTGFRLPSALDNRPLRFDEVEARVNQVIFRLGQRLGPYEMENSDQIVEQIIRPTGLVDPKITIHPVRGTGRSPHRQKSRIGSNTSNASSLRPLTKRMAEDLTEYLTEAGIRADLYAL